MSLPVLNVIGKSDNHDPVGVQILTGRHDYPQDRLPNNKYYGAIRTSNFTRGKITNIDGSEAMKLPGVKAVVSYNDIPTWTQNVQYWGYPVAGVIADDPYTAERALPLIKVEYTEGAAVVDPDAAIEPGASLSGVFTESNVNRQTNLERGNVEAGLAAADVVEDTSFGWTTVHQHNTLETQSALAWWIGDNCYVWNSNQNPHSLRSTVVNALNVPVNKVHLYSHFTGCGEGGKGSDVPAVAAAMSLVVNGYPVQLLQSRKVNILTNDRQFQVRSAFKIGAKKDGTFTAADATWWAMGGVNTATPSGNAHFGFRTTYTIPDAKMVVNLIGTNSPKRGYYRCVNDPPGNINSDSAIDKLAFRLGMDPYELRMKNIRPAYAPDQDSPNRQWGNGGAGVGIRMCLEKVHQESGYASKWHAPGQHTLSDNRLHGIAITGHLDSHGGVNGSSRGAIVTMTPDGKCLINSGGARGTQGALLMGCHMVAETMGMLYTDVNIGDWGNTDVSLDQGGQNGSGFTGGGGSAYVRAAMDARAKVFAAAITKAGLKEISGITVDDLEAKGSEIFYKPDPTKKITFRQAMTGTPPIAGTSVGWNAGAEGGGHGLQRTREGLPPIGTAVNTNGGGATCAEVAVDPETGAVEILGLWNAVDTGRTISKYGTMKELNSGCEITVWMCMFAGDVFDQKRAALIGTQFDESMMMTSMDLDVTKLNAFDIESDDMAGPYGAHGIAEPSNSNVSSIINAIYNATGKWVNPRGGPLTPDIILNALDSDKAKIDTNLFSR